MRDPDGYYIEFCSCESLESYLKDKMATHSTISSKNDWNLQLTTGMMKVNTRFLQFIENIFNFMVNQIHILFAGRDASQKEIASSQT